MEIQRMKKISKVGLLVSVTLLTLLTFLGSTSNAAIDSRQWVNLPEMMRNHMMSNMRDHMIAIDKILNSLGNGEMDIAAEIAEQHLGMSSLKTHGANHMAKLMPEGMREAGTNMHKAASRFALKAQEGDPVPTYKALAEITSACVACHTEYRIK